MKKVLLLLTVLALSACSRQGLNSQESYAEYWKTWGDQQLNNWLATTLSFSDQVDLFCTQNAPLGDLQAGYKNLSIQWAQMNGFPYTAIADFNLGFEVYAWPDKRNMTAARLIKRIDQGALSLGQLQKATAAEKGLPALEWLSFAADLDKTQRCNVLPTVSVQYTNNLQKIAEYHQGNPLIFPPWLEDQNNAEGQSIALNLLFQQIAQISNRLRTSVNTEGHIAPISSEGWRAGITSDIYTSSLSVAIEHLVALSNRTAITVNSQGLLADQITSLRTLLNDMNQGVYQWKDLQQAIIDAEHLIEGPIAQDLDILIGFNNFDGD